MNTNAPAQKTPAATPPGLYRKFEVRRTDGSSEPGGKHDGCDYFVLDITHDPYALPALKAYAVAARAKHPQLATDLEAKIHARQRVASSS